MRDPVIRWWRTDLGEDEVAGVAAAIRNRTLNFGPQGRAFEDALRQYLRVPHVVATTSGSTATLLALKACGVGPGDEVIVPALTFIAPAHAALWLGARVRLADVLPDRPIIDPSAIEPLLNDRTKAVVCVHLNGRAADVAAIRDRVRSKPVALIEDCAQALGSRCGSQFLGTTGDAGIFSLSISKLITTGEGGFIATSDPKLHDRLAKLRNHGVLRMADNVFTELGLNFRLTDLQAAVGLAQVRTIDAKITALRSVYNHYRGMLDGLRFIRLLDVNRAQAEVPLWVEAVCAEREKVVAELDRRGIEAKAFHPCLSSSPHLQAHGDFPNAMRFAAEGVILPSGPNQSNADLDRVGEALREIAPAIVGEPTTIARV